MGWKEAGQAEKFEFRKKGDKLEGKLIDIKNTQYESKVYTIIDNKDDSYYFFGCYKLDSMLPRLVGKYISVTYLGKSKLGKSQTLKDYKIAVWADEEQTVPDGFAEDVPF